MGDEREWETEGERKTRTGRLPVDDPENETRVSVCERRSDNAARGEVNDPLFSLSLSLSRSLRFSPTSISVLSSFLSVKQRSLVVSAAECQGVGVTWLP